MRATCVFTVASPTTSSAASRGSGGRARPARHFELSWRQRCGASALENDLTALRSELESLREQAVGADAGLVAQVSELNEALHAASAERDAVRERRLAESVGEIAKMNREHRALLQLVERQFRLEESTTAVPEPKGEAAHVLFVPTAPATRWWSRTARPRKRATSSSSKRAVSWCEGWDRPRCRARRAAAPTSSGSNARYSCSPSSSSCSPLSSSATVPTGSKAPLRWISTSDPSARRTSTSYTPAPSPS